MSLPTNNGQRPTSSEFVTAIKVINWVIHAQSFCAETTLVPVLESLLSNQLDAEKAEEDAAMGSHLAAVIQADEQDTKKPYRISGINKTTDEGTPLYEFSKLQREEDNRVNYDNSHNDV